MQKAGGMSGRRGLFGGGVISAFRPFGAGVGNRTRAYTGKTDACDAQEKARAKRKRFARALFSAIPVVRLSQPESLASLAGNNDGAGESDDGDHGDGGEAGVTGDRRLGGLGRSRRGSRRSLGGGNGLGLGLVGRRLGRIGRRRAIGKRDFGHTDELPHNLTVGKLRMSLFIGDFQFKVTAVTLLVNLKVSS